VALTRRHPCRASLDDIESKLQMLHGKAISRQGSIIISSRGASPVPGQASPPGAASPGRTSPGHSLTTISPLGSLHLEASGQLPPDAGAGAAAAVASSTASGAAGAITNRLAVLQRLKSVEEKLAVVLEKKLTASSNGGRLGAASGALRCGTACAHTPSCGTAQFTCLPAHTCLVLAGSSATTPSPRQQLASPATSAALGAAVGAAAAAAAWPAVPANHKLRATGEEGCQPAAAGLPAYHKAGDAAYAPQTASTTAPGVCACACPACEGAPHLPAHASFPAHPLLAHPALQAPCQRAAPPPACWPRPKACSAMPACQPRWAGRAPPPPPR